MTGLPPLLTNQPNTIHPKGARETAVYFQSPHLDSARMLTLTYCSFLFYVCPTHWHSILYYVCTTRCSAPY